MYVPRFASVDDDDAIRDLLTRAGVGHLVTNGGGGLDATVVPFLVDHDLTTVRCHLARANPQWHDAEVTAALLVVPVSSAYVSPAWYPSKTDEPRTVPTWNYEVVHVHGTLTVHHDPAWLEQIVRDLTDHHEAARTDSAERWTVDDAPRDYLERQLRAIVGLELAIDRVQAKRKLSQNRSEEDRTGVASALAGSPSPGAAQVAEAMAASS